ncbi:MAG TPA: hypothetical protein VK596_04000 [Edaphobacter sp.]|nr:hypothetical protein [Edaphobacter sp.]
MHYRSKIATARRTMSWAGMACALVFGVSGCRHKPVLPPLPPIAEPLVLVTPPAQVPPPMIEPPQVDLPPVPVASGASPRRERRHRPTPPNTPATAQTNMGETPAATISPEDVAIGALSLGGEANPRAQQEAAELLASIERRLNSLSPAKERTDKAQISRIRNFQRQAQGALNTGDVEGAKTLGTKAKLLLDDLEK